MLVCNQLVFADGESEYYEKTPQKFSNKGICFSESAGLEELYDVVCVCQNLSIGKSNLNNSLEIPGGVLIF